jgi:hypothetical protein
LAGSLLALLLGCPGDADPGDDAAASGDQAYYCAEWASAFCPAHSECDPFRFGEAFRSIDDCLAQVERDCLEPPAGIEPCDGATRDETDECVAYVEARHPEGCQDLFGPSADMSPCEAICD